MSASCIICRECGANLPIGTTRCSVCTKYQPAQTGRSMRERPKTMRQGGNRRPGLRNYDPELITLPAVDTQGRAIWKGDRKELGGFPETFLATFLDDFYHRRNGLNPERLTSRVAGGVTEYQCAKCQLFFPRKRDAAPNAVNWISVDHRVPIREYVLQHVSAKHTAIDDHSWSYYLLDECKAAHLTPANLQPMCQACNSAKNGNKELDGEMRQHSSACRNTKCRAARSKRGDPY